MALTLSKKAFVFPKSALSSLPQDLMRCMQQVPCLHPSYGAGREGELYILVWGPLGPGGQPQAMRWGRGEREAGWNLNFRFLKFNELGEKEAWGQPLHPWNLHANQATRTYIPFLPYVKCKYEGVKAEILGPYKRPFLIWVSIDVEVLWVCSPPVRKEDVMEEKKARPLSQGYRTKANLQRTKETCVHSTQKNDMDYLPPGTSTFNTSSRPHSLLHGAVWIFAVRTWLREIEWHARGWINQEGVELEEDTQPSCLHITGTIDDHQDQGSVKKSLCPLKELVSGPCFQNVKLPLTVLQPSLTTSPMGMEMRFPPKNLCQIIFSKVAVGHHLSLSTCEREAFLGEFLICRHCQPVPLVPSTLRPWASHSHTHITYICLCGALACSWLHSSAACWWGLLLTFEH